MTTSWAGLSLGDPLSARAEPWFSWRQDGAGQGSGGGCSQPLKHHTPPSLNLCSFSRFPVPFPWIVTFPHVTGQVSTQEPLLRNLLDHSGAQLPSFPSVGLVTARCPLPVSGSLGSKGHSVSGS